MLVDANLLLFAVDEDSPFHASARDWLTDRLNGPRRVGLPWQSLAAFVRITTHPRAFDRPMDPVSAWRYVTDWLAVNVTWSPQPGPRHAEILGALITRYGLRGNLIPDGQIAALGAEHGLTVFSADADFARFEEIRWENPLAA